MAADEADGGQAFDRQAAEDADHAAALTGVALSRIREVRVIYWFGLFSLGLLLARTFDRQFNHS